MAKSNNTTGSVRTKPILFSAPMVRALLEGRKTQTRRVIKEAARMIHQEKWEVRAHAGEFGHYQVGAEQPSAILKPKYSPGDLLWVRETWSHTGTGVWKIADIYQALDGNVVYRADSDNPGIGYFSSIHMPRWASRLTLRVTDVRAQRLQDISEEDAIQEGAGQYTSQSPIQRAFNPEWKGSYKRGFQVVWDNINGTESWDANPWVWVYSFEVIKKNVDEVN